MVNNAETPLDIQCEEYRKLNRAWHFLDLLYEGGMEIKDRVDEVLIMRPHEQGEIWKARSSRFSYQNLLEAIVGWYIAEAFEKEPEVRSYLIKKGSEDEERPPLKGAQREFYAKFLLDCDRHGTSFVDRFRGVLEHFLLYGRAYVLIDKPLPSPDIETLHDAKERGELDPYIQVFDPKTALNYERDEFGNLEWIVFKETTTRNRFKAKPLVVDTWIYYDRENFQIHSREYEEGSQDKPEPKVVANGPHAMKSLKKVPVHEIIVSKSAWIGNRILLPVLNHLNQDNAYDWSLFMAALAIPVVTTDDDVTSLNISESGFIKLGKGDTYSFSEPSGTSFAAVEGRVRSLREEIYRLSYLLAQARTTDATPSAASGFAKEMDQLPSAQFLNYMGDVLRTSIQNILADVSKVRATTAGNEADKNIGWDVRGFTFAETPVDAELGVSEKGHQMGIPSTTLEKELDKRAARALLRDADPGVVQKVFNEIDEGPTREDKSLEDEDRMFDRQMKQIASRPAPAVGAPGAPAAKKPPAKAEPRNAQGRTEREKYDGKRGDRPKD